MNWIDARETLPQEGAMVLTAWNHNTYGWLYTAGTVVKETTRDTEEPYYYISGAGRFVVLEPEREIYWIPIVQPGTE